MMTNWVHFENFEEMKNFVDTMGMVDLENFGNLVGKNHMVGFEDLAYYLNYGGFAKKLILVWIHLTKEKYRCIIEKYRRRNCVGLMREERKI